jgi:hypothetical protein
LRATVIRFGALELRRQIAEHRVGFELRIVFRHSNRRDSADCNWACAA